jgi:hypothetical protein
VRLVGTAVRARLVGTAVRVRLVGTAVRVRLVGTAGEKEDYDPMSSQLLRLWFI